MTAKKKKDLKASVEEQISEMLNSKDEPSDGRIKLLALGIKMCALNAKLEESEYGDFFTADGATGDSDGPSKREGAEPKRRRGANGAAGPAADTLSASLDLT